MEVKMAEICIKVPEKIPASTLRRKINELIIEEEMRWVLFDKCKNELSFTVKELDELEIAREAAWKETKKKYDL
jgi:hypothetical protein